MNKLVIFIYSCICFVLLHCLLLFDIGFLRQPRILNFTEIWLKNVLMVKDYINTKETSKQRIIVVGGSSSLFGFNGNIIENNTKYHLINYGLHASLPFNYYVDKIIDSAKDNDIIFLPLEFDYYFRDKPHNDYWYIHNMISWGNGYYKYIDTYQFVLAYVNNSPDAVLKIWFNGFKKSNKKSQLEVMEDIKNIWQDSNHMFNYGYESLSQYGDYCTQSGEIKQLENGYLGIDSNITEFFINEYNRLIEFANTKNIKIFLIYPPTGENKYFSLDDKNTFEKITNLQKRLNKHNIKIYGDFKDFHFNKKYFFNTAYHLNAEGATLRTKAFIRLLDSMEKDRII